LKFAFGPVVCLFGIPTEADAGVAGIQDKCGGDYEEQFHGFSLTLHSNFSKGKLRTS
jgi:hypothetical protein